MSDGLDELIDRIYQAGYMPERWPGALDAMARRYGGVGALLLAASPGQHAPRMAQSHSLVDIMGDFVRDGWHRRNPRLERAMARMPMGFVTEGDLFAADELDIDPLTHEFLIPRGIGRELGTVIALPTGDRVTVTVQRHSTLDPISEAMRVDADALRPHLARAALFSSRVGVDRARTVTQALHALGLPAVALAQGGRAVARNALFEALVPALAMDRSDRIALVDRAADAMLARALAPRSAARSAASFSTAARGHGGVIATAHLLPMPGIAGDAFPGAAWLLLLVPALTAEAPDARLLAGAFGLTPAEARLAAALAGGARGMPEVAAALGISRETARSQLRAVFAKTGAGRQAELVGLLAGFRGVARGGEPDP